MNDFLNNSNNNKILLGKLIEILMPNVDKKFHEKYSSYFLRLLNAHMNLPCFINESTIVNYLENQLSKIYPNNNYNKIEKLQNKLSQFYTKKTFFNRRWAVLYLLLKLSNDTNEYFLNDSSKTLQNLFAFDDNKETNGFSNSIKYISNNYKAEENRGNIINKEENNKNKSKKSYPQNNVIVNETKSNKKITESDLINDLIFVFQGIDGHYINYNNITNSYTLNSLIPWNENIIDIVSVLCELGWLFKKVNTYLIHFNESNIQSQFIQSFSYAIQSELNQYYK